MLPPKRDGKIDRHGKGPFAEPRAKGGWFEDVGKRQSSWLGESVRSILCCLRGSSQGMFPKPSLCTTANSRCQPLYLLAKTVLVSLRRLLHPSGTDRCRLGRFAESFPKHLLGTAFQAPDYSAMPTSALRPSRKTRFWNVRLECRPSRI